MEVECQEARELKPDEQAWPGGQMARPGGRPPRVTEDRSCLMSRHHWPEGRMARGAERGLKSRRRRGVRVPSREWLGTKDHAAMGRPMPEEEGTSPMR